MEMETVVADGKEMDMEIVPEMYRDIISGDFAYDPVRLPLEQDPTQLLYDRKTLQTIWETERHARNPFTRQWFDIRSAIPQTELRKEMKNFAELHGFPAESVIAEYLKIVDEGEMKRHFMRLSGYVSALPITEKQWMKIWKVINIVRLFCEFHHHNIKLFNSLHGFRYFMQVLCRTLQEKDAKDAAVDVAKEVVKAIDIIINGLRSRGENCLEILGSLDENFKRRSYVVLSLLAIANVYKKNGEYIKIKSLVLRAFSTIFHEIAGAADIVLQSGRRPVLTGFQCALNTVCQPNAKNISSEDLNHGITILKIVSERARPLNFYLYVRALGNAVIICISRELKRSEEMSGFTGGQLLEFQMQAQHNSEALEKGVRLIRDIAMEEGELGTYILRRATDVVNDLVHMFRCFTQTDDEDEGNRKFPVLICENNCEMVQCFHYRIAHDGLDISEAIGRKQGVLLDVEVLRKFISDRT